MSLVRRRFRPSAIMVAKSRPRRRAGALAPNDCAINPAGSRTVNAGGGDADASHNRSTRSIRRHPPAGTRSPHYERCSGRRRLPRGLSPAGSSATETTQRILAPTATSQQGRRSGVRTSVARGEGAKGGGTARICASRRRGEGRRAWAFPTSRALRKPIRTTTTALPVRSRAQPRRSAAGRTGGRPPTFRDTLSKPLQRRGLKLSATNLRKGR